MIVIAEHAHAQDRLALHVEPVQRAFAALRAQFDRIDAMKIEAEMLERFEFDRQAVHIPTRDENRFRAVEQMHFDEDVLEHAVYEVPHV